MSKSSNNRSRSKDRFEARYNSMKMAGKGQAEIYNVMLERLSKAIETGEVTMEENSNMTHAEQAHLLLQKATTSLMSKQQQQQQKQKGPLSSSSSSERRQQAAAGTLKCNRRSEAAAWAKANPTAGLPSSGIVSPRTPDHTRRRHEPNDDEDEGFVSDSGSDYSEDISDDEEDDEVDESRTKQEINTTRKLLRGAATRLKQGENCDKGVNNAIYEQLMKELNLNDSSCSNKQKPRSVLRAEAAAGMRPTLDRGPDQVSRRAYAADTLMADKTQDPQNLPGILRVHSKPSERRTHALEILKNLQQQKEGQKLSNSDQPLTRRKSANPILVQQTPVPPPRSSSARANAHLSMHSPVPSLASSCQSHGSGGSGSRGSSGGGGGLSSSDRNPHRRRKSDDGAAAYHNQHAAGEKVSSTSAHRKRANSHENANLERYLG